MKITFRPKKTVSREYSKWYAWRPVKVSHNKLAWFEDVYRREEYVGRRMFSFTENKITHISKEDYINRALRDKMEYPTNSEDKQSGNAGQSISTTRTSWPQQITK